MWNIFRNVFRKLSFARYRRIEALARTITEKAYDDSDREAADAAMWAAINELRREF